CRNIGQGGDELVARLIEQDKLDGRLTGEGAWEVEDEGRGGAGVVFGDGQIIDQAARDNLDESRLLEHIEGVSGATGRRSQLGRNLLGGCRAEANDFQDASA